MIVYEGVAIVVAAVAAVAVAAVVARNEEGEKSTTREILRTRRLLRFEVSR